LSKVATARLVRTVEARFADLKPTDLVLLALSGGGDSTALAHLLARARRRTGLRLEALHLDHGLGPHAAGMRRFVEQLCRRLEVPCHAEQADVARLARRRRHGLEEAGRFARHQFFARAAAERGAAAVALAHTRDDRAETLLLNLVRGAGPGGLAAMRETSHVLLRRPLLTIGRAELRDWLSGIGEAWREDPSNADLRFARNRIRLEAIPVLQRLNPRALEALARTAELLAGDEDYLAAQARYLLPAGPALDTATLAGLPPPIARRLAHAWLARTLGGASDLDYQHVSAVLDLAVRGPRASATDLPGGGRLLRRPGTIVVEQRQERAPSAEPVPLAASGVTRLPWAGLTLVASAAAGAPRAAGLAVTIPAAVLPGAVVRPPRPGDRVQPLGAPGAKPLSRYLIDRKVPRDRRSRIAVVAGEAGILWVIGHQVGEPARAAAGEAMVLLQASEQGS